MFDIVLAVKGGGLVGARGNFESVYSAEHLLGPNFKIEDLVKFTADVHTAAKHEKDLPHDLLVRAQALYDALFQGDLGRRLGEAQNRAKSSLVVRLIIDDDDKELQRVPWEALCVPGTTAGFLGTHEQIQLVRGVTSTNWFRPGKTLPPERLRFLVIAPQESETTVEGLKQVLTPGIQQGFVEWLPPLMGDRASPASVRAHLGSITMPDVIHFMGHGRVSNDCPELLLTGDDEEGQWVQVEEFAQMIKTRAVGGDLRLLVLEACEGAEPGAMGSAAEHLVRMGVDAVASYLWSIKAEHALKASKAFYEAYMSPRGDSRCNVVASVTEARQVLGEAGAVGFALVAHIVDDASARVSAPDPNVPFLLPYLRDQRFVGRSDDLAQLHTLLQTNSNPCICGLGGMGGIGKTYLAVEYVHRYRGFYPGGIYWVNAAQNWQGELAKIAEKLGVGDQTALDPKHEQRLVRAFVEYLAKNPGALLVFDNVNDPLMMTNEASEVVQLQSVCRILFTTRKLTNRFPMVEIRSLDDESALRLLLNSQERRHIFNSRLPERETAKKICATLGNLPLALALASAHLEKCPEVSLNGYLDGLIGEGAFRVFEQAEVDPQELPTRHETALHATLSEQWAAVGKKGETSQRVLQTAALLREGEQISWVRLALLTGLSAESTGYLPSPLAKALRELSEWSLVEMLTEKTIRVHNLVRQFALSTLGKTVENFAATCAARLAATLLDVNRLADEVCKRGVDAVLSDVRAGLRLAGKAERELLEMLYKPVDREAHSIRVLQGAVERSYFLQQFRNRCFELRIDRLRELAESRLREENHCWLRERFAIGGESEALVRTLVGHDAPITSVAITPDGRFVVSSAFDNKCIVWDFYTGKTIRSFDRHTGSVHRVTIAPDGLTALSASYDKTIKVWKLDTGEILQTLEGHTDSVSNFAISPNADMIVSVSDDRTVRKWELGTRSLAWTVDGHQQSGTSVVFSPDQPYAFSSSIDGTIKQWRLESGELVRSFEGHGKISSPLAITRDGNYLLSVREDGMLNVVDIASGESAPVNLEHRIATIAITPNERYFITGSEGGKIRFFDFKTRELKRMFLGHVERVADIAVTADSKFAVSASFDRTLKIWDLASLDRDSATQTPDGHTDAINDVSLSADGQHAVTGSDDKTVKYWNVAEGRVIRTLEPRSASVTAVALSASGHRAVLATWRGEFIVWNPETGDIVCTLAKQVSTIRELAISPDQKLVYALTYENKLASWDLETGRAVLQPSLRSTLEQSALGTLESKLRFRDVSSGQTLRVVEGRQARIDSIALTPDRRLAIIASGDKTLNIWSVEKGTCVRTLEGHTHTIREAVVSRDGQFIVSVSLDRTVRVWHIDTGKQVAMLEASAPLICCAMSSDGSTILVGDAGGGLHILDWHRGNLEVGKPRRPTFS